VHGQQQQFVARPSEQTSITGQAIEQAMYGRPMKAWLKSADLRLLFELCIVGVLVVVFLKIAHEASDGTEDLDRAILLALRNAPDDPLGGESVQAAMLHLTGLGSSVVTGLITLIAVSFLALAGRWRYAALVLGAVLGTLFVMLALKGLYDRPRPPFVTHLDPQSDESFPSGHSMIASALYLTLATLIARALPQRRLRVFTIATGAVLALAIGVSRLYMGVHYPTDVLAGWTVGCAWALVCGIAARKLAPKVGEHEPTPATDDT
jgi:undecaprenyl-diphosphatase